MLQSYELTIMISGGKIYKLPHMKKAIPQLQGKFPQAISYSNEAIYAAWEIHVREVYLKKYKNFHTNNLLKWYNNFITKITKLSCHQQNIIQHRLKSPT